jgi:hypothetical protein
MACHLDDIPNIGDTHVYDIASLSFLIIRTSDTEVKAFPNAVCIADVRCAIRIATSLKCCAAHFMVGRGTWMAR